MPRPPFHLRWKRCCPRKVLLFTDAQSAIAVQAGEVWSLAKTVTIDGASVPTIDVQNVAGVPALVFQAASLPIPCRRSGLPFGRKRRGRRRRGPAYTERSRTFWTKRAIRLLQRLPATPRVRLFNSFNLSLTFDSVVATVAASRPLARAARAAAFRRWCRAPIFAFGCGRPLPVPCRLRR